ncbi:hypothetical protein FGO68_gene3951 [Halteria grandinella]|uniref:Uncharacterized protein n=1 Tax=Halteria grandinella TaxID=5974 RepID=A0A8J8NHH3_HALGN|nr:hypothetical protein FGO68_gene3951 [Halteria grandinella]
MQGDNMFSIQELEHLERNSKFIRWGRIFSLNALTNYQQFSDVLACLQYNFSQNQILQFTCQRACFFNKNHQILQR